MVLLRHFILLLILSSCAKMGYLWTQGIGQLKLLNKGRLNEEVLNDVRIPKDQKEKIKKIMEYKKWFYEFWNRPESGIYTKTTFLKDDAVTYLVIASPFNKIEAKEECFPIKGCFPYLGFFDKGDAKKHVEKLEEKDWITYIRPVYAYSTLGHFEDTILSSFFKYSDFDLAELVFHELFHTIFFLNDEGELNENLANYFGKEMAHIYFKTDPKEREKKDNVSAKYDVLARDIVDYIHELERRYTANPKMTKKEAIAILDHFLESDFKPHFEKLCQKLDVSNCFPTKRKWNNASFAAFMTYEKEGNAIESLKKKLKLPLKDFFYYIEKKYKKYEKEDPDKSFSDYLLKS